VKKISNAIRQIEKQGKLAEAGLLVAGSFLFFLTLQRNIVCRKKCQQKDEEKLQIQEL